MLYFKLLNGVKKKSDRVLLIQTKQRDSLSVLINIRIHREMKYVGHIISVLFYRMVKVINISHNWDA